MSLADKVNKRQGMLQEIGVKVGGGGGPARGENGRLGNERDFKGTGDMQGVWHERGVEGSVRDMQGALQGRGTGDKECDRKCE